MKHLCASALAAFLIFVVLAPVSLAGEVLEGDGYTVTIPDGFREALSMSGNGSIEVNSRLGCLPIDGIPETTMYVYGEPTDLRGTLVVASVQLKSGHEITSIDDLGLDQVERMNDQLPDGFSIQPRKVGKYDAVEMTMEREVMGDAHTARMVSIAAGDRVLVVMMQVVDDEFPAADAEWEQMVDSIKIEKGLSKVVLYGGIGIGALLIVVFFARLTRGSTPDLVHLDSSPPRYAPPTRPSAARAQPPTLPSRPPALPPVPSPSSKTLGARAAPPRPPVAAPSARPGLRSTLPSSGHWGDRPS